MLTTYTCLIPTYYHGVVEATCATASQRAVPAQALASLPSTYTTDYCSPWRAWRQWRAAAGNGGAEAGVGAFGRR